MIKMRFLLYARFCSSKIINKIKRQKTTRAFKIAFVVWHLYMHLVCVHTKKVSTALTIKEDLDDFNKEEKADDPEDLEVFQPTNKWQILKPGQAVPRGFHVRLNLQTGQQEAKCLEAEEGLKYSRAGQRYASTNFFLKASENSRSPHGDATYFSSQEQIKKKKETVNNKADFFTTQKLKEALKKFKGDDDNPVKKDSRQNEKFLRSPFRSVNELKKDMDALNLLMETDAQIMRKLLSLFNSTNSTVDQKVTALLDLEYLVHQVDNAQNLVSMGGMKLVTDALNDTDVRLQEGAAYVLGSAVSSNPSVQVEALESGALQKLLTLLATPHPMSVKKKALFALACLLHNFPFAQSHFVKIGGMQVLGDLFQEHGADGLRVRIVTLLNDMITEKELISQTGECAEYSLPHMLAQQGWCSLVPELLASPEHDRREKALHALLAMMPHCQTLYQQNPSLTTFLRTLQKEYQKLAHTEEALGEENGYFGEILALLDSLVKKMH